MAEVKRLTTRADWYGLQGGSGVASRVANSSVVPPDNRWTNSIRIELRDGDLSPWQADAESALVSSGNNLDWWRYGTVRWTEFWLRVDQVGSSNGWWCFLAESHLHSGDTQAPWAIDVSGGSLKFRHWVGPTTWPTQDSAGQSLDLGNWHHYRIGQFMTTASNGWFEFWRDNTRVHRFDGRTAFLAEDLFAAIGWYRHEPQSGTAVAYIAGYVIHDVNPGFPGTTPPPPVTLTAPTSITAGTPVGQSVTVTATAANADTNRTGVAIYRKTTPWTTGQAPSAGTEVAYQAGTTNPTTAAITETLAFGTYYYAAFSINRTTNTYSTFIAASAVTITQPPATEVTYNHAELNVPDGTWYYAIINANSSGDLERLAATSVTVGTVAQAPLIANSLVATYISGGDVLVTLSNPSDANRTNAEIWRRTSPWSSNSTAGATLVTTFTGTAAMNQSITDINLATGTYYYAVLNNGPGGTVREESDAVTVTAEAAVDTLNYAWPGGSGVTLPLDTWKTTANNTSAGSSVVTLGDNTARIRVAKLSGTDAYFNLEHKIQYNMDYPVEEDSRVYYFEHTQPTGGVEIMLAFSPTTDLTNVTTANKLVYVKYSTLTNANGTFEVGFKNGGSLIPMGTLATGAGTTTSTIVYYVMFTGTEVKVAVRDRLGVTTIMTLVPSGHPFTAAELGRMSGYVRAYTTSASTIDTVLNRIMMFENQGESLTNLTVTPLKTDNTVWTVGEDTGLWVKTRFNATPIPDDPSMPIEYVVEVDDVAMTPSTTSLPVTYDISFSFDTQHRVEIYSRNRSPFPSTLEPGTDTEAPTLTVDGPASGASITATQNFNAIATSDSGIREVRWIIDSRVRKIDQNTPYTFSLNPNDYPTGAHQFQVVVVSNNEKTNTLIRSYNFGQTTPTVDSSGPGITINGPVDTATISENFFVLVSPEDPSGIQKVEFLMDDLVRARATTPSYTFIIDPFAYTEGAHTFSIKVYDHVGNVTTVSRSITIDQPIVTNPTNIKGDVTFIEPGLRNREDVIWFGSFDADPWWDTFFLEAGNPTPTNAANRTISTTNSLDGKALRIRFPGGSTTCGGRPRFENGGGTSAGGTSAYMDISTTGTPDQEELFLRYYVRFDPGFAWVGGGNLPGLLGGNQPVACGDFDNDGWSGLHIWGPKGKIGVNLFVNRIGSSLMNNCGLNRYFRVDGQQTNLIKPGVWHCIEARYLLNTPGEDNGVYQAWFDGKSALHMTKVRYRDTGKTYKIDTLMVGSWFRGNACNWWPKTTQYLRIDSMVLAKTRVGLR
jgi:hypothetical protein